MGSVKSDKQEILDKTASAAEDVYKRQVQSVYDTAEGITLTYTDSANGTPYYLKGDALLVAIGRRCV